MKKGLKIILSVSFMIAVMIMSTSVFARENGNSFDGSKSLVTSSTELTVETETPTSGKKVDDTVYKVTPTTARSDIRVLNENVTKPWKNFAGDIDTGYIETEFMLDNDVCEISVYAPVGKDLNGKLGDMDLTGLSSGSDYYYFHILRISTKDGLRVINGTGSDGALFDTTAYGTAGTATKLFNVSKGQWHKIRVTLSRYDGAMTINFDDNQEIRVPYLADSCIAKYGLKLLSFCPRNLSGGSYTSAVYLDNLSFKSTFIGAPIDGTTVKTAEESIAAAAEFKESLLREAKNYTFSFNDTYFTYTVNDENKVCITGFSFNIIPELTDGILEIPAAIEGMTVTEIGDNAFNKTEDGVANTNQEATRYACVSELKLPDTIEKIGARAFFALYKIGYIKTPSALKEIVLKGSLTSCGDNIFGGSCAKGIQIYSYPSSIEIIREKGDSTFVYSSVYVEKEYSDEKSGTYTVLPFVDGRMIQKETNNGDFSVNITALTGNGQPVTGEFSESKTVFLWNDMTSIVPLASKIGGDE